MLLQQQLAEVGISIDIKKVDPSQWINFLIEGDYELGTVYWTNDIIDPDQKTAFTLIGDDNRNFFSNWPSPPEVTELVKQARVEQDFEKRSELYAAAAEGRQRQRGPLQPVQQYHSVTSLAPACRASSRAPSVASTWSMSTCPAASGRRL